MSDRNYYSDHRVRAKERRGMSPILGVDNSRKTARVQVIDKEGNEEEMDLPILFVVCPACAGSGGHVNPSVDCDGLTYDDFAEDPDFAEEYMSGTYDVPCYECNGQRVVPELDRERIDPEVMANIDRMAADYEA